MRKIKFQIFLFGAIVCLVLYTDSACASIENGPIRKLGRGVVNLTTGWLELGAQVARTTEMEGSLAGATIGLGRGVVWGVGRTLVGAIELVTFPIPNPLTGYDPVIRPEFVKFRDADR